MQVVRGAPSEYSGRRSALDLGAQSRRLIVSGFALPLVSFPRIRDSYQNLESAVEKAAADVLEAIVSDPILRQDEDTQRLATDLGRQQNRVAVAKHRYAKSISPK